MAEINAVRIITQIYSNIVFPVFMDGSIASKITNPNSRLMTKVRILKNTYLYLVKMRFIRQAEHIHISMIDLGGEGVIWSEKRGVIPSKL